MTTVKHDMCYRVTLALKGRSHNYNPKRLVHDVDALKEYVQKSKYLGSRYGDYDLQLSKGAMDDRWYSLKIATRALTRGVALVDVCIYTYNDMFGNADYDDLRNGMLRCGAWEHVTTSKLKVVTMQYILD